MPSSNTLETPPGMMDLVVSSYIPTLSSVIRSQRQAQHKPSDLHMLVVSLPSHSLPSASKETDKIRKIPESYRFTYLCDSEATISMVLAGIQASNNERATWLHLACHGRQTDEEPMKSAFKLYDGPLPLWRIAQNVLVNAEFAMLLCCESGKGSAEHPNEVVHLAAGLQFAGFQSIVGTLWSMMDDDGPIIAEQVYKHLFRNWPESKPDSSEAAFALHQAVLYLRDQLNRTPLSWVPFVHFGM